MKRELVGKTYTVNARLQRALEGLLIAVPVFAVIYGCAIQLGYVAGSVLYRYETFVGFAVFSALLLVVQLVTVRRNSRQKHLLLMVSHHIVLATGLLYIFGLQSPLTLAWLLLTIGTMICYGRRGALLSYLGLIGLMAFSLLFIDQSTLYAGIQYILRAGFIAAVVLVFSTLQASEFNEQTKVAAAEEKHSKQREALLTIINGTSQAIFTINNSGAIRIYNAALLGLLDTNDSLSGKNVDDVFVLSTMEGEPVSLKNLVKNTPRFERDDLKLKFPDGDEIRLRLSVNKIQSAFSATHRSGGEGYVCIARDVTKEKSLEEERDEFISVVSHELRTPVAITEGTLSNLQFFLEKGADPKKLTQSVHAAHEQVILLSNMINDLGTLSRADRGVGDSIEEIDLRELAETMFKNYEASAAKKGLKFNLDIGVKPGSLTTSRLYLEEALQNFITNAIKYTSEGSVTLHVDRKGSGVEFGVTDTGIGISKSDIKHIFEKFYRSEDYRTRETSGTGLGLYVVSKLMHKLGSEVHVSSRLNHGSTFSFVLSDKSQKTKP